MLIILLIISFILVIASFYFLYRMSQDFIKEFEKSYKEYLNSKNKEE